MGEKNGNTRMMRPWVSGPYYRIYISSPFFHKLKEQALSHDQPFHL
jgi:hypothetical protein